MVAPWIIAGAALLVAIVSWIRARRTARRLDQLSQMYWELKYEQGELRVQLQRLQGGEPPPGQRPEAFVPLASLKR
jgi:hypothetical protein